MYYVQFLIPISSSVLNFVMVLVTVLVGRILLTSVTILAKCEMYSSYTCSVLFKCVGLIKYKFVCQ